MDQQPTPSLPAASDNDHDEDDQEKPIIELIDVSKTYDLGEIKVHALREANLTIRKGEFVSLIGPSGSGKSTLMNTLGFLDRPTSGSYRLAGKEMADLSRDTRARIRNQRFGFVFQNFNLLNRTTAVENVELPLLYNAAMNRRQRRRKATELLNLVGLGDRMKHHPSQLSGGQQQRVAIARALVNDPDILMADEPTGNLDTRTSRDVIRLFRDLNESRNLTIILVTHDQNVARIADRVVVLGDGKIIADTRDFSQAMESLNSAASVFGTDDENG
jgi:ABC-type lipoprotein export system ATPase subunit